MKYIFILNSFSLKEKVEEVEEKIKQAAIKEKLDYIIEVNSKEISTEEILKKYKKTKNVIIAVGGDGIINRVLNEIVNTKNILGFIPIGTGNDFYKSCQEQINEKFKKIDLVKINDKYFINVSCFGIDADIGNNDDVIHSKFFPKSQRYNIGILSHFLKYKPRNFKVKVNNEKIENSYMSIAICNASYYGGGYKIGSRATVDDCLLDIYLIEKMSKIKMATLILGMNKARHEKSPHTKIIKSKKIEIESKEEVAANIDGEPLISKKFEIELIEKGIEIYFNQKLINLIIN